MENKKNKIEKAAVAVFWLLFAFSVLALANIFLMNMIDLFNRYVFFISAFILLCLGIALIVLAVKTKFRKISKSFLILTGSAAAGMVAGAVLHNLVYALFIKLFGENFWGAAGDEPVLFIFATIICPIALFTGIIGTVILIAKKKLR
ncbi:MAG: hypothetical protein JW997_07535 [Actinobacteria bacterium]|nr:hypothetical protein [Actinomycetota bacterium]